MAQHYAPEDVSGAVLGTELATDLVKRGYQVTFLTCAPNYPLGKVYPGYKNKIFSIETIDGVRVIRVWSFISTKSFWRRIFNYGTFSISAFWGGLFSGKHDLILSFSPPLPLGASAWLLSRIQKTPWIVNVMDIYPEIAVISGILKNPIAIKIFTELEKFIYHQSSHIQVLSEGFKNNLLKKGVPPEKISIIPVWADPDLIYPEIKCNSFSKKYNLDEKFVILYSGNLGVNTSLEDLIIAANYLKSEKDIYFVFVGEGTKKEELITQTKLNMLDNVLFLPFQPRNQFNLILASASISIVTLSANAHFTSLPSKTFNIMASNRPILAVTPFESEIAHLIQKYSCGIVIPPGNPKYLSEAILSLKSNPAKLDQMGNNGRQNLIEYYSRNQCVDLYEKSFLQVLDCKPLPNFKGVK
jgi:colanic acid biosynthesis glycosyl transferase WcaI